MKLPKTTIETGWIVQGYVNGWWETITTKPITKPSARKCAKYWTRDFRLLIRLARVRNTYTILETEKV